MPLEISEIGVHIAVGAQATNSEALASAGGPGEGQALTAAQHQAIVNTCVQQVLRNLRQMEER